jgi:hypothetical protein
LPIFAKIHGLKRPNIRAWGTGSPPPYVSKLTLIINPIIDGNEQPEEDEEDQSIASRLVDYIPDPRELMDDEEMQDWSSEEDVDDFEDSNEDSDDEDFEEPKQKKKKTKAKTRSYKPRRNRTAKRKSGKIDPTKGKDPKSQVQCYCCSEMITLADIREHLEELHGHFNATRYGPPRSKDLQCLVCKGSFATQSRLVITLC